MEDQSKVKRIKLDSEADIDGEVSYDILEWFPILVCQNVFKYLSGKDIIQASEVNKEWYKFTGETQQMKKIEIVFGSLVKSLTDEHMQILRKSKRKYQNISISRTRLELILPILKDRAGSWKSMEFDNCDFSNSQKEQWHEVLRIMEPSVEELYISPLCVFSEHTETDVDPNWTFPCLKSLEISDWDHNVSKYFVRCTSLVYIQLTICGPESTEMVQDAQTMLGNSKGLEELEIKLSGYPEEALLYHPFEFKLKYLCIAFTYCDDFMSIFSFLERQAPNLEDLKINWELNQMSLELILVKMPKLTSLTFDCGEADIDWTQTFPVNKTISSLELICSLRSNISFINLIKVLPNLKHIHFSEINDEQLLSLAQKASALESLEVEDFSVSRLPEENLFPHLKKFKASMYSCDLSESAVDNNFARLVKEDLQVLRTLYLGTEKEIKMMFKKL